MVTSDLQIVTRTLPFGGRGRWISGVWTAAVDWAETDRPWSWTVTITGGKIDNYIIMWSIAARSRSPKLLAYCVVKTLFCTWCIWRTDNSHWSWSLPMQKNKLFCGSFGQNEGGSVSMVKWRVKTWPRASCAWPVERNVFLAWKDPKAKKSTLVDSERLSLPNFYFWILVSSFVQCRPLTPLKIRRRQQQWWEELQRASVPGTWRLQSLPSFSWMALYNRKVSILRLCMLVCVEWQAISLHTIERVPAACVTAQSVAVDWIFPRNWQLHKLKELGWLSVTALPGMDSRV